MSSMSHLSQRCKGFEDDLVLYAYGELPTHAASAVEQHLRTCPACSAELSALQGMQQQITAAQTIEVSATMLAQARVSLADAIESGDAARSLAWHEHLAAWLQPWATGPALASVMLVAGFIGGGFAGAHLDAKRHAHVRPHIQAQSRRPAATPADSDSIPADIATVSDITAQPGSNLVQVHYNRLVPGTMMADATDPRVQQLLLLATQGHATTAAHAESVSMLADQCQAGNNCSPTDVRRALMAALRYDKSAAVRLKALDGLARYVAEDETVRNSVLATLLHDPDADLRTHAVQMLTPVEADGTVRQALHEVATEDRNPYLRTVSRQTLESGPEIQ